MGRPPKRNLNYSTWDVNVLENDTSIDNLIDAQGPAGFYVYFALCQKAYATDGYFYRWGYDNAASDRGPVSGTEKCSRLLTLLATFSAARTTEPAAGDMTTPHRQRASWAAG